MNAILGFSLPYILPLVLGSLSSVAYQWVKKASGWVDRQEPQTHAFVVAAITTVLPLLGKVIPGFHGTDLGSLDQNTSQAILALLAQQVTHAKLSK